MAKQALLNSMTIIHCWKIIKSTSGFKRVANLANIVYYNLMTVLYVRITGLLMYMYLKIVSTLTTMQCKNGYDRTNALVPNATKYCQLTYMVPLWSAQKLCLSQLWFNTTMQQDIINPSNIRQEQIILANQRVTFLA